MLRVHSLSGRVKVYGTLVWEQGLRDLLLQLLSRLLVGDILWLRVSREVLICLVLLLLLLCEVVIYSRCWHLGWTLHHLLPTKGGTWRRTVLVVVLLLGRWSIALLIFTRLRVLHIHVHTEDGLIAHLRFVLIICTFHVFRWISSLTTVLLTPLVTLFLSSEHALLRGRLLRWITDRWAHMLPPLAWTRVLLVWGLPTAWSAHCFGFTSVVDILVVILGCGCRHRILGLDIFSNVAALDPLGDLGPLRITNLKLLGLLWAICRTLSLLGGKGSGWLLALCLWRGRGGAYLHCALVGTTKLNL